MVKFFLLPFAALLFIATANAQIKSKTNIKDISGVTKSTGNLQASARRANVQDAHDKYANLDSAVYLQIKVPYKPPSKAAKKAPQKQVASSVKQ